MRRGLSYARVDFLCQVKSLVEAKGSVDGGVASQFIAMRSPCATSSILSLSAFLVRTAGLLHHGELMLPKRSVMLKPMEVLIWLGLWSRGRISCACQY